MQPVPDVPDNQHKCFTYTIDGHTYRLKLGQYVRADDEFTVKLYPCTDQHQPVQHDPADDFLAYVEQRAGHKLITSEQQFVRKFYGDDPIRIDTARHFHQFVIQCYDEYDFQRAVNTLSPGVIDPGAIRTLGVTLGVHPVPSPIDRVDTTDEPTGNDESKPCDCSWFFRHCIPQFCECTKSGCDFCPR